MPRSFLINRRYNSPHSDKVKTHSQATESSDSKLNVPHLGDLSSLLSTHVANGHKVGPFWSKLSPALSDSSTDELCNGFIRREAPPKEASNQFKTKRKTLKDQLDFIEKSALVKEPNSQQTKSYRKVDTDLHDNSNGGLSRCRSPESDLSLNDSLDKDLLSLTPPSTPSTPFPASPSSDVHVCPDCGKQYSTSSNLTRHRQTHRSVTDKKARKCPHCDKVYVSMPAYSMHVRTHTQGCQCHYCGKCFSRPWLLQGHIRTHTGEKPFKCHICAKAFADKSNLRAHVQTHSLTKPYICQRCGKAFALKSYLYKHEESSCMRLHRSLVRFKDSDSFDQQALKCDSLSIDHFSNDSNVSLLQVASVTS